MAEPTGGSSTVGAIGPGSALSSEAKKQDRVIKIPNAVLKDGITEQEMTRVHETSDAAGIAIRTAQASTALIVARTEQRARIAATRQHRTAGAATVRTGSTVVRPWRSTSHKHGRFRTRSHSASRGSVRRQDWSRAVADGNRINKPPATIDRLARLIETRSSPRHPSSAPDHTRILTINPLYLDRRSGQWLRQL